MLLNIVVHFPLQLLDELIILVQHVRQHMRRFLPELLALVSIQLGSNNPDGLKLLRELATHLKDDVRQYVPELLPHFVMLIAEAERTNVSVALVGMR